jgi:peptidoglycan/LPS O-acetylase OafA/YrhL
MTVFTKRVDVLNLEKLTEFDYLRGFSALAVIAIHVLGFYSRIKNVFFLQVGVSYVANLAIFAVPSFVFISGLVLYKNYDFFQIKWAEFYKKRFYKILPIYLLFSFFYIILLATKNFMEIKSFDLNFGDIIFKIFTGGAFYHL